MRKKSFDNMTVEQQSRWIALFEAINIIVDKAEENGNNFNYMQLKHPAIKEFIDENSAIIYRELNRGK